MATGVTTGNAKVDGENYRGWFVGDFEKWNGEIAPQSEALSFGLRNTRDLEIKWGIQPQGEVRPGGWSPCSTENTISILIRGHFHLRFRSATDRSKIWEITLLEEGDYAMWPGDIEHTWEAKEDSVILTVRWPDLPNKIV